MFDDEQWPIAEAQAGVRRRLIVVLDAYGLPAHGELLRDLLYEANELWTAEQVARYTCQKPSSAPRWCHRHNVPRFTGAVYSRTAVESARAVMPSMRNKWESA
jgi:hypothetical protein